MVLGVMLAPAFWLSLRFPHHVRRGLSVLTIGVVLTTSFTFYAKASGRQQNPPVHVDIQQLSRFDAKHNLLIVLMDTFQSDVLDTLLHENPELGHRLRGFHFYPNTLGVAPTTYLTMPAFHSGEPYDRVMSLYEYYDRGVRQGSFMAALAQNGYEVDLINPIASVCPNGARICVHQNTVFAQLGQDSPLDVTHLMDLGLFRVLPGVLKRYAFDGTMGLISYYLGDALLLGLNLNIYRANEVLDFMTDHMHITPGAPTARLIHLFNTHPPYMRDRHCQFIGLQKRINRQGMTEQTACAVDRFTAVLDAMEAHGIYDSAMVILVADTGASSPHGARDMANLYAAREAASAGAMGRLMGGANPVLAIKYPGSDGPLRVSKTAAQLTDIPHTVCAALGHCQHHRGLDLATSPPNPDRIRRYHDYTWKHEYWGLHNIPGIVTYDITGPLWRASAWTRTRDADLP